MKLTLRLGTRKEVKDILQVIHEIDEWDIPEDVKEWLAEQMAVVVFSSYKIGKDRDEESLKQLIKV